MASGSTSSRSCWAISSRPVASGTGGVPGLEYVDRRAPARRPVLLQDLLGAFGLVALAPAAAGLAVDHVAQPQDPVGQGLGTRRAAGDVHGDGQELVGRDERVVVEHAHARAAGAHAYGPLRIEHLVVE